MSKNYKARTASAFQISPSINTHIVFAFSIISLTKPRIMLHPFFTSFFLFILLSFNGRCSTMASGGGGFASGTIDLGGLLVRQVTSFNKIWAAHEGGPDNLGATFYEPSSIPEGFFMLGSYSQPKNVPLSGYVVAAKYFTNDTSRPILRLPVDYALVYSSNGSRINQDGIGYIWLPLAPDGYKAVGYVVTNSPKKPSPEKIRCVQFDFTGEIEADRWVWGPGDGFNVYGSILHDGSIVQTLAIGTGTFVAQSGGPLPILAGLKNVNGQLTSMPNLDQIKSLVQTYSPVIYFHPDEQFLPSTVDWFFQNGALLYQKGQESNPTRIDPNGSNLPQGGPDDENYWLDLPTDGAGKDRVAAGDIQSASAYLHVKPMSGGTITDIAIWVFYPYNGAAKARIKLINLKLGRIGEHVGDWEHVTLRISNFDGQLSSVFFSQHRGGPWVSASQLEYQNGKKPVVYASLHGHAAYPHAGLVLLGNVVPGVGLRDDTAKSNMVMDTGANYVVVSAEYLGSLVVESPWLNFARRWGPKIAYNIDDEIRKIGKFLPGKLKIVLQLLIRSLPPQFKGEDGPTGPKMKSSWSGDERGWP